MATPFGLSRGARGVDQIDGITDFRSMRQVRVLEARNVAGVCFDIEQANGRCLPACIRGGGIDHEQSTAGILQHVGAPFGGMPRIQRQISGAAFLDRNEHRQKIESALKAHSNASTLASSERQ